MASKTVTMTNPTGLHTRPGGVFVAKAKEFESKVEVENEGKKVNGKSLLKLLSIGIKNGSEVTVHAEGPDAEQAVEVLGELLATKTACSRIKRSDKKNKEIAEILHYFLL